MMIKTTEKLAVFVQLSTTKHRFRRRSSDKEVLPLSVIPYITGKEKTNYKLLFK